MKLEEIKKLDELKKFLTKKLHELEQNCETLRSYPRLQQINIQGQNDEK